MPNWLLGTNSGTFDIVEFLIKNPSLVVVAIIAILILWIRARIKRVNLETDKDAFVYSMALKVQPLEEKVNDLTTRLAERSSIIQQLNVRIRDLEYQISELQKEIIGAKKTISILETDNQRKQTQIETLTKEKESLIVQIEELKRK